MNFRKQCAKHILGFAKQFGNDEVFLKNKAMSGQVKHCARDVVKNVWE